MLLIKIEGETERPLFYDDIIYMIALLTTKTTHHIYFENQIGYNHKLNDLGNILDKKMNWKQVKKLNTSKYFYEL